ncbi:MAG: hypothetical protein H0U76_29785 [Ktedonobacteraceae bacterium]|nr:hypothetical protein [Ktedonobacteraceae bacterium]
MRERDEKGYPWFSFDSTAQNLVPALVTLVLIIVAIAGFFIYTRISTDLSPDSVLGYTYAILGTLAMLLATFLYSRARRSRGRGIGRLNSALRWHIGLGTLALVLLFLHSFANFNPRSGTYALYGMIAIVISGAVGRTIDRLAPRLIGREASKALTEQGEDRIEAISRNVQAIVLHNTESVQGFHTVESGRHELSPAKGMRGPTLSESWDLAYISLAETPQEVNRNAQQYRFVPDSKSPLADPGALLPGYTEQIENLKRAQLALQREQFFRALIRYWRIFHILLVLLTIGLTLWHLEYAATLLLPTLLH